MAKFDIEKLINDNTNEGKVDYAKVNELLEEQNRNIVVKEATKEVEKLKGEQLSSLIKELGVDGETVDDVKLYIKKMGGSTDEVKEENLKLLKQLDALTKERDTAVEKTTQLETQAKDTLQTNLIKGLGVTDERMIKYLKWDFNNQVTEDVTFEDLANKYAKENDINPVKIVRDAFGPQGDGKAMDISGFAKK
jgi:hypothetical protein